MRVTTRTFETDVRDLTTDVGVVDLATVVRVSTLTAVVSGQRHCHMSGHITTHWEKESPLKCVCERVSVA